ncbi:MAG: hypothetical protein AB7S36_12080 [Planctomycetota bacterium]
MRALVALLAALLLIVRPVPITADDGDDPVPADPDATFHKLVKQAEAALDGKEYAEAARLFGLAVREKPADTATAERFKDAIRHVEIYNTRFEPLRSQTQRRFGIDSAADVIRDGLGWLVRTQQPDGRWINSKRADYRCDDLSTTALALLALMADGSSEIVGTHKQAVKKGIAWILAHQTHAGSFGGGSNYSEGLAALAVVEAFAMGGTDATYNAAQKSLTFILGTRCADGGWLYGGAEGKGNGDVSVTGMMFQPLKQAQAAWLDFNYDTLDELANWIGRITPDAGSGANAGVVPYRPGTNSNFHNPSMAAIGSLVKLYAGRDAATDSELAGSIKAVADARDDLKTNVYFLYYGTMVAFLVGGETWTTWAAPMVESVRSKQDRTAPADGAAPSATFGRIYDANDFWVSRGYIGPEVYHCMELLSLECAYRYVPKGMQKTERETGGE